MRRQHLIIFADDIVVEIKEIYNMIKFMDCFEEKLYFNTSGLVPQIVVKNKEKNI